MGLYFVKGAPCSITGNVGVTFGLANGTTGNLHSLTMEDGSTLADHLAMADGSQTEIVIPEPLSINVVPDIGKKQRERIRKANLTLVPGEVVVPIKRAGGSSEFRPSSLWAAQMAIPKALEIHDHEVDLAFAVTDCAQRH